MELHHPFRSDTFYCLTGDVAAALQ
jgi:hypothetical protein